MSQPWKHPKTGTFYLRERTPADLLVSLRGQVVTLPIGDGDRRVKIGEVVQASLGSKDIAEAKRRFRIASASLTEIWASARAIRSAPVAEVSQKIADEAALAGWPGPMPWSRAFERFESQATDALDDLQIPNKLGNRAAIVGEMKELYDTLGRTRRAAFGWNPAASLLKNMASGEAPTRELTITFEELWERWRADRVASRAPKTISRYTASVRSFGSFLESKDIRSISDTDVYNWAIHRRDHDKISEAVINRNDLVAVSSVLTWATTIPGGRLLKENPARKIRLDEPRHQVTRERSFRDAEIRAILGAALAVVPSSEEDPSLARAKHWCPLLAAYSGARITEITALRREDFHIERGSWVMDFPLTKTDAPRSVPLHEHLIALGFLDVLNGVPSGPIFYDPTRHRKVDAKATPAELRGAKIAGWVREVSKLDERVSPNHAWRHTFKSRAVNRMEERVSDAITGHRPTRVPRKYEKVSMEMMIEALAAFPRYDLDGSDRP